MNCYFDTSIYNQILDDPQKDTIIKEIKRRKITVIPSVVNLCEILSTWDKEREKSLLKIYHELRNNYHALKPFTFLLKDAVKTIQEKQAELVVNIPIKIDKDTEEKCRELTSSAGKEFDKIILETREFIQEKKNQEEIPDAKTFFEICYAEDKKQFWVNKFREICKELGFHELRLDENEIMSVIKAYYTPWKYHLDSKLYYAYKRTHLSVGYGKKKIPGGSDLEQSIYLYWADLFVIKDSSFYDFLKELNELRGYNKKIFTYIEFKNYLGLKH